MAYKHHRQFYHNERPGRPEWWRCKDCSRVFFTHEEALKHAKEKK